MIFCFGKTIMPAQEIIEAKMNEILANNEFNISEDKWFDSLLHWLSRILERFNFGVFDSTRIPTPVVLGLTAIIVMAIIVLSVFALSRLFVYRTSGHNSYSQKHSIHQESLGQIAMKESDSAAEKGDYPSAIKWLFIYSLWVLELQKFLLVHKAKTNTQYIWELNKNKYPHITMFKEMIKQFNRIRYGDSKAEYNDYAHWKQWIEILQKKEMPNEK